ncbi:hypothetical protein LCGC14_0985080 [marine sediment metagenome]|uniref:Periplasmic copper-binding protein NosD beta helix domain-containing protein n=1 Tax=marine sediment metagenome TaxID=412755 RepID=A0A0F9QQR7_9ZZZZ|nr:hypothetical protein [bacterium]
MKTPDRKSCLLFLIITMSIFSNTSKFTFIDVNNQNNVSKDIFTKLEGAGYWDLTGSSIFIDDDNPTYNWAITAATNDWCSGSGTWTDPYIIENVTINGQNSGSVILIRESSVYFIIKNCTLSNSGNNLPTMDSGINIQNSRNGFLINNSIINNNGFGIVLEDANNFSVLDNKIFNNDRSGIFVDTQYDNVNSDDNLIENNTISYNNEHGIYIDASWNPSVTDIKYNIIRDNAIKFNGLDGIHSEGAENNSILMNEIFNNTEDGIYMGDSNCLIMGNTIFNNTEFGIENYGHYNIIKEGNYFLGNSYGVRNVGDNTIIKHNYFTHNDLYGLVIISNSDNDLIFGNNFTNNSIDAYDYSSTTSWDNGSLGNYWDNYGGVDANDDGIGDTAYDVAPVGGSVDNYPIWEDGDDLSPYIIINSPSMNNAFGVNAPIFNITINDESPINATWYTIDGGANNYTFSGLTGSVNQIAWDNKGTEIITLRFYANDSLGYIGLEDVLIWKDLVAPRIMINSPEPYQLCGVEPPTFSLTVNEPNIQTKLYSINGRPNITFTTQTQISQSEWDTAGNGTVSIIFYIIDKVGNTNSSEVIVRKDAYIPDIIILSPVANDIFGNTPPGFIIYIIEEDLALTWYTISDLSLIILIAYYFTGTTGTIDQDRWDIALEGQITITFYSQDSAGNIGTETVIVIKRIPSPPSIPGYNMYLLYGIVFIGLIITLQKKHKA